MPENKYSNPETERKAHRYWEMRRKDLKCMYLAHECSIDELEDFFKEEGVELPDRNDYDDLDDYKEALEELAYERSYDYGLSVDVVEPCTFKDQPEPYLRYQFSWGGGQDEIRYFFTCGSDDYDRAEFWYLDWGTGHGIDVSNDEVVQAVWDNLSEIMYEQLRECENWGCEQYDNCDSEYKPYECKYISEIIDDMDGEEVVDAFREVALSEAPEESIYALFDSLEDMVDSNKLKEIYDSIGYDPDEEVDDLMSEHPVEEIFDVIKDWFYERDEMEWFAEIIATALTTVAEEDWRVEEEIREWAG